jgi:hypothetical protein
MVVVAAAAQGRALWVAMVEMPAAAHTASAVMAVQGQHLVVMVVTAGVLH